MKFDFNNASSRLTPQRTSPTLSSSRSMLSAGKNRRFAGRSLTLALIAGVSLLGIGASRPALAQNCNQTDVIDFSGGTSMNTPYSDLLNVGGTLYGTTFYGGSDGAGTIYSYNPAAPGAPSANLLASFVAPTIIPPAAGTGINPIGGLVANSLGTILYGTASAGGANGVGSLYSYNISSGTLSRLKSFNLLTNGSTPTGDLLNIGGVLYGTTTAGTGATNAGTIFTYNIGTNTLSNVANFGLLAGNGLNPSAGLTQVGTKLYGTTVGTATLGSSIFSYDTSTHALSSVYTMPLLTAAHSTLTAYNGLLYGTTQGVAGLLGGSIFSFDPTTNTFTTLHSFSVLDGLGPQSGLTVLNGILYGTTYSGGSGLIPGVTSYGTTFELDPSNNQFTTIGAFTGSVLGSLLENKSSYPYAALTVDGNSLYGTTQGAVAGLGVGNGGIFSLTPTGGTATPEPASWAAFLMGGIGLAGLTLKARKRNAA